MKAPPVCPCDQVVHPRVIDNVAGLSTIDYRAGTFATFRDALLRARKDEAALKGWHPTGQDLALQLLEWWAYLADVLAFYNERALHDALLRTAVFPQSIRRIVGLLGYRPRPGIAATGVVAALTDSIRPFVVPRGFAIKGASPDKGLQQVFEVDEDVEIGRVGEPAPPLLHFPPPHEFPLLPDDSDAPSTTAAPGGLVARDERGRLRDSIPARIRSKALRIEANVPFKLALDGVVTTARAGDPFVIIPRNWDGSTSSIGRVLSVEHDWDPYGKAITDLTLTSNTTLDELEPASVRFLRPTKLAHLWLYHVRYGQASGSGFSGADVFAAIGNPVDFVASLFGSGPSHPPEDPSVLLGKPPSVFGPSHGFAHLEAITRGISAGDPVLFEARETGIPPALVRVTGYSEEIWYGNAPSGERGYGPPVGPPAPGADTGLFGDVFGGEEEPEGPIPVPHTKITFEPSATVQSMTPYLTKVVVRYGWQEIGQLAAREERATTSDVTKTVEIPSETILQDAPVLVEDATGSGTPLYVGRTATLPGAPTTDQPDVPPLVGPLRALLNLLPVSRGETVEREVLGSGDPILSGQEFTLARSPLTYLADPAADDGYRSTLRIRVDGIEWREVPSFFRQPPNAPVFVTYEDDEEKTHVRFGDGEHGRRLPSGTDNVVATYRHGSGAAVPETGTLTTVLEPKPGVREIRNPIPMAGGADPDPPELVRRLAPRSVLSFGRAISRDDYEVLARRTAGVGRASACWVWDDRTQRNLVKVFVGDDDAAVAKVRNRLEAVTDPNLAVIVERARPVSLFVSLVVRVDPDHDLEAVQTAVRRRLVDDQQQPFGRAVVEVGQVVYDSHVSEACLSVAGVVAIRNLRLEIDGMYDPGERHSPGEGGFFVLDRGPEITSERHPHGQ